MMKRRHFNLIKTGRKSKLALAVGLALAMSAMGSVYASGNDDTFKNFANGEKLNNIATSIRNEQYSIFDEHINRVNTINEFQNSTGLASINADKAYALGYTGNGVKLGMMENGLPDILHKDLNSNGENNIQNKYGNLETSEHSTHVVGIMAARKNDNIKNPKNMHGVAYNSKVDAFGISKGLYGSWKDDLLIKIGDDIVAVNESFGGGSSVYGTKIINESIINKGGIIVRAIGNNTEINPSINVGIIDYDNKKYRNNYITVGALDSSSSTEEASFLGLTSNTPGNKLSKTTVMAPGVRINSTKNGLKYGEMTGTSMAAPHVTGVSALVKEAFPYLSGKGLCDTILSTANNKFRLAPVYCQLVFTDDGKLVKELKLILVDNKINNLNSKDVDNAMKQMYEKYLTNKYTSYEEFKQADIKRSYRECTREEVFGQGIVDAGKAVQGLGAIDVDRLSQEDITTRYSNEKFYMYQVDTKKAEDNFKGRNYSIWSNDISEKNVNDIHGGLEKTGSVGLILLGENTYTGPTVAKGGFLQIVRGVGGDVYVGGDSNAAASAEINGYAKNIYALESGKVKISDIVSKNYANVDADFLATALPDTNKVDINGGLFAIGKNSITGEGSTINVNLTRSDSAIKGALHQDELGKINLSLANEAKFILQQGAGYYAGNSYKSNDTINNLNFNSFASFDMSQDGVYSTLKIGNLTGNDGQFILGTDLLNQKGDNLSINKADNSEQWISILDKNGVYVDNENETKEVFIGSAPSTLWFKGYALAQDVGVNQYKFNPHIYFRVGSDYKTREWYFDGFDASVSKPDVDSVVSTSGRYTTDNVLNKGLISFGLPHITIKVDKGGKDAMLIYGNNEKYLPTVVGVRGASLLGDGDIKVIVRNDRDMIKANAGYEDFYGDYTTGIEYDGGTTFKFNQNVDLDVKGKNLVYGLNNYCVGYSDRSSWFEFNKNLNIDVENTKGYKAYGLSNRYYIKVNGDTNINLTNHDKGTSMGINNQAHLILKGNLNISDLGSDGEVKITAITSAVRDYDPLDVYFTVDKDINIKLTDKDNVSSVYNNNDFVDSIDVKNGTFKVGGKISIEGSVTDYSIRNQGIFTAGDIKTNTGIKNKASMEITNNIEAAEVYNESVLKVGKDVISNNVFTTNELNVGGKISTSTFKASSANVKAESIKSDMVELGNTELDVPVILTDSYKAYDCNTELEKLDAKKVVISSGGLNVKNLSVNGDNQAIKLISYREGDSVLRINEDGTGVVKIIGNIIAENSGGQGIVKVNLNNNQSHFDGELKGFSTDSEINIANGALWNLEANNYTIFNKYKINLQNGGIIDVPLGNIHVFNNFSGNNGIIKFDIHQAEPNSGNIKNGMISIDKNDTEGAHHTIVLNPDTADFLIEEGTKINPLELIGDYSEKNGGYKINFTINQFDAGAYNYTPTLVNESIEGVNSWKVTNIKLTGSTPDPTPDPDPNPNPNPNPDPTPDPKPNPTPDPDPNPNPNPNPDPTPDPKPNPTPDPDPTPAPVLSNLTYNTRANAINNYYRWRDEYNNLQKRLGDLRMSTEENGLWARTFHGKEESGKYGLNNQYNAFQIGYDKQLLQDDGGKWFIGAAVTSYDGKTNYAKQGKADNNSIGLALYGSYLGEKGHYFDVVARHSRLKSELTSYAAGTGNKITGDYHNWGSSLSMEYGRRISMKHDFYLQPEAELTYGTTSSASYSLSDGSMVKQDGISSLTARAGLTVGKEFKNSNIFASISAVHDFGDDNVFSITDKYGKTYKDISNLKDSWYELSVGGNVKFNNNTYIYADLEKTFGGDIQTKWRYNFGVRYSF